MHLFNEGSLEECYYRLDGKKAVGVDGMRKEEYGENLASNLKDLTARLSRMAYRPQPVREVLIPKEGRPGAKRPLGISNFEDKIVQTMTQRVLESIYEPLFLDCSFGFRPGRGCHDAIRALNQHLFRNEVKVVIDVDIENFFGTIDHALLEEILLQKIKDPRFIRYIKRMFKAGVLADGELKLSDEGVPQGSICSPILSNIFAHYVIDDWIEKVVKRHCRDAVESFRYCDDMVICCADPKDAQRIMKALEGRLAKFGLKLNTAKTTLVSFSKEQYRQGVKQGYFDFLGFTFYLGRTKHGAVVPKLKTNGKRIRNKLKRVSEWARKNRNRAPLKELWNVFCSKLRGHVQYYSASYNTPSVSKFLHAATRIMYKWLNRRSQKKSFDWNKFELYLVRFPLPTVKVYHKLF